MEDDKQGRRFFSAPTRRIRDDKADQRTQKLSDKEQSTKKYNDPAQTDASPSPKGKGGDRLSGRTELAGPRRRNPAPGADAAGQAQPGADAASEAANEAERFVTGWLVILEGPGRGRSAELSYGMNTIGRGADQHITLDFGDKGVSRAHCMIAYDAKGRQFFIQHAGGQNLTYVEEAPVLAPVALENGMRISIGDTELGFVALCGPQFEWSDEDADASGDDA